MSKETQHVIAVTAKEILHKEQILNEEKGYVTGLHRSDEGVQGKH